MPYIYGPKDFTSYRKMMVFIDGENITMRFQELKSRLKVREGVNELRDVYVWRTETTQTACDIGKHEIIRATYYTYAIGDETRQQEINDEVKSMTFSSNYNSSLPNNLYPYVLRKVRNKAAKGVDIKMTLDMIHHANNNNYDTALLISGDGDYLPVIEEVIRAGKQVYLAAFSSGLNPKLKSAVDYFIDLDPIYFEQTNIES
ncbi:NYN domain-containing protein [Paenibacillus elgii]|uniref:NYN domain-containing protein n=1 Tax=Paenibacillus elgii TaxID=189691 RepID=UPI000248C6D4|nr:NYN domain-containing protein [Paenibacillus elgii]